jgi:hypothetical protein
LFDHLSPGVWRGFMGFHYVFTVSLEFNHLR